MRSFIFIAMMAFVAAAIVPRLMANATGPAGEPTQSRAMVAQPAANPPPPASAGGRTFTVRRDSRGHFQVEGRVDGRRIGFMVDTGATVVAIPEREATRLGIHLTPRDYRAQISTANGVVRGAATRLNMVEVGGLIVYGVDAVVMPDTALSENLLGMSFLSRLRRFEIADGRLVLEQ
jgi:aspartyl protease family protein